MRYNTTAYGTIHVTLSKRNLLALLGKLEDPESMCTIGKGILTVSAEPDELHYGEKEPGKMNETSEKFIKEHGGRSLL